MEKPLNFKIENGSTTQISKNMDSNIKVSETKENNTKLPKKPRRDKSDLGDNFIAPDGGVWAWIVCIAAGVSNLSVYPCSQQFGFIYRERLSQLGFSTSQATTFINSNFAISACTGLLNGPMFRRFSYRQVAIAGSMFVFVGTALSAFCTSFVSYMIFYSLIYGIGMGISVSASALALNTYFKNKRRRATGFSWTITGLGPIFLPHLATYLLARYEVEETVLIFAAFSLHSLVSAMTYQPAQQYARKPDEKNVTTPLNADAMTEAPKYICKFCKLKQEAEDEDEDYYDITDSATPMLSRANDGWFGSKPSLISRNNSYQRFPTIPSALDLENGLIARLNRIAESDVSEEDFLKPNFFKSERDKAMKRSNSKVKFEVGAPTNLWQCTCAEERALLEVQPTIITENGTNDEKELESPPQNLSFFQKVVIFFDLDLLRDFTYVNMVAGMTTINFGELNFSILTPFILHDYGFKPHQMTTATSVLASVDLVMRFLVPFLTEKISWDNRVFYLIGVLGIAFVRIVVASTQSYYVILVCFFFIGFFKGIRTVFWPLLIPSHVPLKRLPAASGLQLLITGLFTLAAGPLVGMVRDHYNYSVTIHCLNFMSFFAATSWFTEYCVRRWLKRRSKK